MTRTLCLTATLILTGVVPAHAGGKGKRSRSASPSDSEARASANGPSSGIAAPGAVREASAREVTLGAPIEFHNMSLVPVVTHRRGPFQRYTLLEAGLKSGRLAVRELAGNSQQARVSEVEVKNRGEDPVYLLGGEMILGGKQDRIISRDTVIPPDTEWTKVSVFCVERGRWNGGRMKFEASGALADLSIQKAAMGGNQSEVWSAVDEKNLLHGTQSATSTYRRTIQNAKVRKKVKPYVRELVARLPQQTTVAGLVFAINGRVHVADIFGNPVLFAELTEKLLSAYVLEALGHQSDPSKGHISSEQADTFIKGARKVKAKAGRKAGRAMGYKKENASMVGTETRDEGSDEPLRETYIAK